MQDVATMEALTKIELPGLQKIRSGKVREVFELDDSFLFVATDRISAFDCVLPNGIPGKGNLLTQLSAFWFQQMADLTPNHMISIDTADLPSKLDDYRDQLAGRSMIVRKAEVFPVECVVRGYLIGSGWKEYQADRSVCGIALREGYQMADQLDAPIFTPATKADEGHDENISFERMVDIIGQDYAEKLRDLSFKIYERASAFALEKGIIIADTKFEFGLSDGEIMLIDEVLTPDSSRFWPASSYAPNQSPPSYDKQIVRDYLATLDWDKNPPAPSLPEDIVAKTRAKYLEVFKLLTGRDLITK